MAIVTIPDVLAAVKTHWQGDATLAGVSLHFGRVPIKLEADINAPYAVVSITESPPQWNSGSSHIQVFTLQISVWTANGNAPSNTILHAMDLRFDRGSATSTWLVSGADGVLDLMPMAGTFELDAVTRDATDQAIGMRAWELWVQASH